MPLLSNMELKGIERGKEIGSLEKARQAVKRVLEIRFEEVFSEVGAALVQVSNVLVLDELLELAVTANSLGSSPSCVEKCIMYIQKQEVQYVDKFG